MEWTVITEQITVIKSPGIPASTALSLASQAALYWEEKGQEGGRNVNGKLFSFEGEGHDIVTSSTAVNGSWLIRVWKTESGSTPVGDWDVNLGEEGDGTTH
jgi:hypothetical protein